MKIRRATPADGDGICRVHVDAVRKLCKLHYTADEIGAWTSRSTPGAHANDINERESFVAFDDGGVLGFTVLDRVESKVIAAYVDPAVAGRGIGRALLDQIETVAREHGLSRLHVEASLNSVGFYLSAGYEPGETRKHRLESGIEIRCVFMTKRLSPDVSESVSAPRNMPVFLAPYDESWPCRFQEERKAILGVLGDRALAVEHIGSTAIPGIMAKPVVDIMVVIANIADAPNLFDPLERLGYHYFPYDERRTPERRWFCKPHQLTRTHHLHLVERGSRRHRDWLAFRDYLRSNDDEARRYEALKRHLAARFPDDRESYTEGKTEFVEQVIQKALKP